MHTNRGPWLLVALWALAGCAPDSPPPDATDAGRDAEGEGGGEPPGDSNTPDVGQAVDASARDAAASPTTPDAAQDESLDERFGTCDAELDTTPCRPGCDCDLVRHACVVSPCRVDEDCGSPSLSCFRGACWPALPSSCTFAADCPPRAFCFDGRCLAELPFESSGGDCPCGHRDPGIDGFDCLFMPECGDDAPCPTGQICLAGACEIRACRWTPDCPAGRCDSGHCTPEPCEMLGDMPPPEDCSDGRGEPARCPHDAEPRSDRACAVLNRRPPLPPDDAVCAVDADCGAGRACVEGLCLPLPRPRCHGDADCGLSTVCLNGECTPMLCLTDLDCPPDAECDVAGHTCVRAADCEVADCRVRDTPCRTTTDCGAGFTCHHGRCLLVGECLADAECPEGMVCEGHLCAVARACPDGVDCARGEVCTEGLCRTTDECVHRSDCPAGQVCFHERCVESDACVRDSDCRAPAVCNPVTRHCGAGVACSSDADCGAGEACLAEQCVRATRCAEDLQCPVLDFCDPRSGLCRAKPGCLDDRDCPPALGCDDGACLPLRCHADSDCAGGDRCLGGTCTRPPTCGADSDCVGLAGGCRLGRCAGGCTTDAPCGVGRCAEGLCRDPAPVAEACRTDAECGRGRRCDGTVCVDAGLCRRDADCPALSRCREHHCVAMPGVPGLVGLQQAACDTDGDCGERGLCNHGLGCRSIDGCRDTADCPMGFVCRNEDCLLADACEDEEECGGGECRAGLCVRRVMTGEGFCPEAGRCPVLPPPTTCADGAAMVDVDATGQYEPPGTVGLGGWVTFRFVLPTVTDIRAEGKAPPVIVATFCGAEPVGGIECRDFPPWDRADACELLRLPAGVYRVDASVQGPDGNLSLPSFRLRPAERPCEGPRDCGGRTCADGLCADFECEDDAACAPPARCVGGQCRVERACATDPECGAEICVGGVCRPPYCVAGEQCPESGRACLHGRCWPGPCVSVSDCGLGETCAAGACRPDACADGGCAAPLALCRRDVDCGDPELVCEDGQCGAARDDCVSADGCAAGGACIAGRCTAAMPCRSDAVCRGLNPALLCVDGTCAAMPPACAASGDCAVDESCAFGACIPGRLPDCLRDADCGDPVAICEGGRCGG